jgi:hypothetical protein
MCRSLAMTDGGGNCLAGGWRWGSHTKQHALGRVLLSERQSAGKATPNGALLGTGAVGEAAETMGPQNGIRPKASSLFGVVVAA